MCVLYRNLLTFPCSNTPLNDLLTNISCFLFKHIHCFILTLIHIYSFLYLYTFVTSNTDIHLIIHVHTFIHTCTYIHTTHTHTLVHKCMRARTHIHTHTHTQPFNHMCNPYKLIDVFSPTWSLLAKENNGLGVLSHTDHLARSTRET